MAWIPDKLRQVATEINSDGHGRSETVRAILSWFDAQRRGYWVVYNIKDAFQELGLTTEPNFEHVHIDSIVEVQRQAAPSATPITDTAESIQVTPTSEPFVVGGNIPDPVPRIGMLASANRSPSLLHAMHRSLKPRR